jgi:hypothetical protein
MLNISGILTFHAQTNIKTTMKLQKLKKWTTETKIRKNKA